MLKNESGMLVVKKISDYQTAAQKYSPSLWKKLKPAKSLNTETIFCRTQD